LLIKAAFIPTSEALKCLHNATVVNEVQYNGTIISEGSSHFDMGVLDCSTNLNRCETMGIGYFKTLDVGKDTSPFTKTISSSQGAVVGRCCMSQADVDKIQAQKADVCYAQTNSTSSCYCTTDKCTGSGA
ncbi:hypothetical protein PENTCL1PPCAC_13959, partial [Pristionchus entomophagus]